MATLLSTEKALQYARSAESQKDWKTAFDLYKGVLSQFPKNRRAQAGLKSLKSKAVKSLLQDAKEAQAKQNWSKSQAHLALAFRMAPEVPEIGSALAHLHLQNGAPSEALETVETLLSNRPDHDEALLIRGIALRDLGRFQEAKRVFEDMPETADSLTNLAILARATGDQDTEYDLTQKAVKLAPQSPTVHWNFANAQTYEAGNLHVSQMLELVDDYAPNDTNAAPLRMALFKAFDDLGDSAVAFSHLKDAKRLAQGATPYDFKKDALRYALSKNIFANSQLPAPTDALRGPIFVTGLPRSGTTLVERILSQDPRTTACGELSVVERAASGLLQRFMDREISAITPQILQDLRSEILEGMAKHAPTGQVIIDKMPLNFRWIGFICAALPEARIIHLNRDPMAVAWSLYRHLFAGLENGFSNSMEDIARFMVLHSELMTFWKGVCTAQVLDINYADLIAHPKDTTQRMAEFTGLTWSEDWLHPETANSHALTASAAQVRKPIYQGSDEGWRRYETQLAPLKQMLISTGLLSPR